jgi:predicted dehydrogenase
VSSAGKTPGPTRVAVVGCGYWGPNLVRNFCASKGMEVAAICDLDTTRLAELAMRYPVGRATTEFDEILSDATVDAVAIATPVSSHRALCERALRARKHVWVEKPLASTVSDGLAIARLAKELGLCLFVDHTFVYTPAVQKIRELVRSNELGDILYFDSVRVNLGLFQSDTNVCWDLGPHDISIADYVLDRRPTAVSAIGVRHFDGQTENLVYMTLKYEGNLIAHFHFNWLAPVKVRMTMIGGSRKMIVYDDLEPVEKVKVYDRGVDVRWPVTDSEARRRALVAYRSGDMWSPRLDQTEALAAAAADFSGAIKEHRDPVVTSAAGLRVVGVLEAAQRSLESGGQFVPLDAASLK